MWYYVSCEESAKNKADSFLFGDDKVMATTKSKRFRPDYDNAAIRRVYEANRKKIFATQSVCGICGKPVDKSLKFPHPMSGVIDHIIPIDKGGHPCDLDNLQLAHNACNRAKSNKIYDTSKFKGNEILSNRLLPQSRDWTSYRSKQ